MKNDLRTNDPSTHEKLAQEIDDLYEAPSRIRLLRHILEREFRASRSVAEAAKEIKNIRALTEIDHTQQIESILSRFREPELRELREECGRLRKDKHRIDELIRLKAIWSDGENQDGEKVKIIYGHRDAIDGALQARAKMQPDHEFGTEQVHSCLCEKCGATKPYEPETFGDEAI